MYVLLLFFCSICLEILVSEDCCFDRSQALKLPKVLRLFCV
jgi:hypothetical protein